MDGQIDSKSTIKIKAITPKFYVQQCPVCNGFGTLKHGTKTCQGCNGKGYVVVPTGMEGQTHENESNT